jgi:hypothetical protein
MQQFVTTVGEFAAVIAAAASFLTALTALIRALRERPWKHSDNRLPAQKS